MERRHWEFTWERSRARDRTLCLGTESYLQLLFVAEGIHPQDPIN